MNADFGLTGLLLRLYAYLFKQFIYLFSYGVLIRLVYKIDKRIIYALKELYIKPLVV